MLQQTCNKQQLCFKSISLLGKKKSNENDLGKTAAVVINILENYLEKKYQAFDDNC